MPSNITDHLRRLVVKGHMFYSNRTTPVFGRFHGFFDWGGSYLNLTVVLLLEYLDVKNVAFGPSGNPILYTLHNTRKLLLLLLAVVQQVLQSLFHSG